MNDFIPELQKQLKLPLPGQDAQLRMAPSFRISFTNTKVKARAGVMLLLYPKNSLWHIVFMKRPEYDGSHSGQISFPGGKIDLSDQSLLETALRETEEEIGILSSEIKPLGKLSMLYIPVSEFEVHPVVGFINFEPIFNIDAHEVQYLIEYPLFELFNPLTKKERPYSGVNYSGTIPYFDVLGHEVWGATAMILNEFLEVLKRPSLSIFHQERFYSGENE